MFINILITIQNSYRKQNIIKYSFNHIPRLLHLRDDYIGTTIRSVKLYNL